MRLYTPLSDAEAAQAERGEDLGEALFWTDHPEPDEAQDDAIWVGIEVPEAEVEAFECEFHPERAYREFQLPTAFVKRYRPVRVTVPERS